MKELKWFSHYLFLVLLLASCSPEFLDVKRNKSQVVPATIADFQSMLDRWDVFNNGSAHKLAIVGAGEFHIPDERWGLLAQPYERNGYIWAEDVYEGGEVDDWNTAYHRILLANIVLDGLSKIEPEPWDADAFGRVKGSALFFRAFNYYQLAQLFCKPYDGQVSSHDPGIPLRLDADVSQPAGRGTVEAVYRQLIADLEEAVLLLPVVEGNKLRPTKPAAYLLLARIYLHMGNYDRAGEYAAQCLEFNDTLLDFNTLDLTRNELFPVDFGLSNPEVVLFSSISQMNITAMSHLEMDSTLLDTYAENDLRRIGYFRDMGGGRKVFRASYSGLLGFFSGLSVSEAYLIKAECDIRLSRMESALALLNRLLKHRFATEGFVGYETDDSKKLLEEVLAERRRELVLRGTRWEDMRRLNKESELAAGLTRLVHGVHHELVPGSPRWVWPIPESEVQLAGLEQNER